MPQMSPLLWFYLFLLFSLMLMFSMIKIYFFLSKKLSSQEMTDQKTDSKQINWLW